jgi:hypothetical protein
VQAVVRHMKRRGFSLQKIVLELAELGVLGRRGTAIGVTRVFEMLHGGRTANHMAARERSKAQSRNRRRSTSA